MIFWSFVILAIIGVICLCIGEKCSYRDTYEWVTGIGGVLTLVAGIAIIITSIVLIVNHLCVAGDIEKHEVRYEHLVYEYESDMYDNDNDVGKKELMNQIREWNEDLTWYKTNQRDFWIGIFVPNIYDQFEFIELKQGD